MNKRNVKSLLAISGMFAAGAAVMMYASANFLVSLALNRKAPKILSKVGPLISGGETSEFADSCAASADKLKTLPHQIIKITSYDGLSLVGHYYPCKNAQRIIIAFHGWRSSWNGDFGVIADFWHSNQCSVLYAEQRGQNSSEGEFMGFGLTERHDCVCWADWCANHVSRSLPVYLAGISMGASTVLMASDLKFSANVCGIMADCGFTSPGEIWRHVAQNNLHLIYNIRRHFANEVCRKKIHMSSEDFSTAKALSRTDIPVLFIHGDADTFVPPHMTLENYKACASEKRILIVSGANHAMSYLVNRTAYEDAMLNFWRDFDKPPKIGSNIKIL